METLVSTLTGAAIGVLTNYLAILMLFRPYTAWTVLGRQVPFTPGAIPKDQSRLAEAVGRAVQNQLTDAEELLRTPPVVRRILESTDGIVEHSVPCFLTKAIQVRVRVAVLKYLAAPSTISHGIPLGTTVKGKIVAMNPRELEEMTVDVTRGHLRHLVWLGGIVGAIIGCIQGALS
jgi:uncharacterized membrane protein YheB (UPF0754 family)